MLNRYYKDAFKWLRILWYKHTVVPHDSFLYKLKHDSQPAADLFRC